MTLDIVFHRRSVGQYKKTHTSGLVDRPQKKQQMTGDVTAIECQSVDQCYANSVVFMV